MEIYGTIGVTVELVIRSIKAVRKLRDLHRASKANPAQCERIRQRLGFLHCVLQEKHSLGTQASSRGRTGCLSAVWMEDLKGVKDGVESSVVELEAVSTDVAPWTRRQLKEFFQEKKIKKLLDKTEESCDKWLNRLCAADSAMVGGEERLQILGEVRNIGESIDARRSIDRRLEEILMGIQRNQDEFLRVLANPPPHFESMACLNRVLNQADPEFSLERLTRIVFDSCRPPADEGASSSTDRIVENTDVNAMDLYELDRIAFNDLHPRAEQFLKSLERREIGSSLSEEEKQCVAITFEKLWKPWEIDSKGLKLDVRRDGFGEPRPIPIGTGSYGSVFSAKWDSRGGVKVAVKVLNDEFGTGEGFFRADFYREASLLYRLNHPSIVRFYGARWPEEFHSQDDQEEENSAFLVMELMDGGVVTLLSPNSNRSGGRDRRLVEKNDVFLLRLHIAEALAFIHSKNILHLDVKPKNILLRVCDGRMVGRAKLIDFGVSREKQSTASKQLGRRSTGSVIGGIGTAAVMAPEVLVGSLATSSADFEEGNETNFEITAACDVFSFGITIWSLMHLLKLRRARRGSAVVPGFFEKNEGQLAGMAHKGAVGAEIRKRWIERELAEEDELREIVLSCVEHDPSRRPPMSRVSEALRLVNAGLRGEQPSSRTRRQRSLSVQGALHGFDVTDSREMCRRGVCYALGEFDQSSDPLDLETASTRAFSFFEQAGRVGQPSSSSRRVALCNLGWCYEHGFGVPQDFSEAASLYEEAEAHGNLSLMYRHGLGVEKDESKALELLDRPVSGGLPRATTGCPTAWGNLCYLVEDADLLPVGRNLEVKYGVLLRRAKEIGSAEAANKLGILYYLGAGVSKDVDTAVRGGSAETHVGGNTGVHTCEHRCTQISKLHTQMGFGCKQAYEQL